MAINLICSVEGCGKAHLAKGLCGKHYQRLKAKGSLTGRVPRSECACLIAGCAQPVRARGYCIGHWRRLRVHGNPRLGRVVKGEPLAFIHNVAMKFTSDECLIWPFHRGDSGYGTVKLPAGKQVASRYVCRLANGDPHDEELQAAHSCGNGSGGCVNPKHLRWATRLENQREMVEHGKSQQGEKSFHAKLTSVDVREIRKLAKSHPVSEIAAKFAVTPSNIKLIVARKTWRDLPD